MDKTTVQTKHALALHKMAEMAENWILNKFVRQPEFSVSDSLGSFRKIYNFFKVMVWLPLHHRLKSWLRLFYFSHICGHNDVWNCENCPLEQPQPRPRTAWDSFKAALDQVVVILAAFELPPSGSSVRWGQLQNRHFDRNLINAAVQDKIAT